MNKKQQYPSQYVHTKISFNMGSAMVELRESIKEDSQVAAVVFEGVQVSLGLRGEDSIAVSAALRSVLVEDYFTMRSTVMKSNGGKIDPQASKLQIVHPDLARITDKKAPLVTVNIDVKPPVAPGDAKTSSPDVKVSAKVLPLAATFSRPLIDRISFLFSPPKRSGEAAQSVSSVVSMVASDTIETVKRRAENSVKYALLKRQIIGPIELRSAVLPARLTSFPGFRYRCRCYCTKSCCSS